MRINNELFLGPDVTVLYGVLHYILNKNSFYIGKLLLLNKLNFPMATKVVAQIMIFVQGVALGTLGVHYLLHKISVIKYCELTEN